MVGFLNQLATGRGAGARQVTGFVFLGRAYVEQVGGAVVLVLPLGQTGQVEAFDAGAVGDGTARWAAALRVSCEIAPKRRVWPCSSC